MPKNDILHLIHLGLVHEDQIKSFFFLDQPVRIGINLDKSISI